MTLFFGVSDMQAVRLVVGILLFAICSYSTAKEAQIRPKGGSTEAVVSTLLDDVDALNTVTAGHTKEINELKKKVEELKKKLDEEVTGSVEAQKKALEGLEESEKTTKEEVTNLKTLLFGEEKLFWLTPTLEVRLRPEFERNRTDLNSDANDDDMYYLQRVRIGLLMEPNEDISANVVIQDSRKWGSENDTRSDELNHLDLHEAWIRLNNIFTQGLFIQGGRMELTYGDEWQIGQDWWHNVGRAFDGARIWYEIPETFRIDLFATVIKERGVPMGHDANFYGLYANVKYEKYLDLDIYALYLDDDSGTMTLKGPHGGVYNVTTATQIGTAGVRAVSIPVDGLVLEGEVAVQFGKVDDIQDINGTQQVTADHLAVAYQAKAVYEIPVDTKPTVGVFFTSASGDANPYDDSSVAYRPLFITQHNKFGMQDLFTWQGVWSIGPTISITPVEDLLIRTDLFVYNLTADGGIVQAFFSKTHFGPDNGRFLGLEWDVLAKWKATSYLSFEAGYSLYKPGAAVDGAKIERGGSLVPFGSDLSHFTYLQATLSL